MPPAATPQQPPSDQPVQGSSPPEPPPRRASPRDGSGRRSSQRDASVLVSVQLDELVRRLLAEGDQHRAATQALRVLGPRILGYLRSILRDGDDAADAFSIFAEHLWRGLPAWRGESSLRTWAYKLAWNAALNLKDEAWRRKGRPFLTGEASRLADEIRTRTAVRQERQRRALDDLRAELTQAEQTLLILRIDQQLSWGEIGQVLASEGAGPDETALRKRYERLKEKLAKLARERGLVQ